MKPTMRRLPGDDVLGTTIELRANGGTLSGAKKREMLERVRGGEHLELEVDAIVYIQRDEPNRNHFRFAPKILKKLARSAVGVPFIMDHKENEVMARGGTVIASQARKNDAGEMEIVQTFKLVKPWAVEGFLDGTIDRFSIGAHVTGELVYRHNGEAVLGDRAWPEHFPGDEIQHKGKKVTVEYVATDAEMVETSAVNVPAVRGTSTDGFRAALSALFGSMELPTNRGMEPQKEKRMKNLMSRLGLSADASEASALEAFDAIVASVANAEQRSAALEIELNAERESHVKTRAALAEFEAAEEKREGEKLSAKIDALYDAGKLTRSADRAGNAVADPMEETLRKTFKACGEDTFDRIAAGLAAKAPVASEKQSDDVSLPKPGRKISERQRAMNAQMGMDDEQFEANLKAGGVIPTNYKPVTVGGLV